MYAYLKIPGLSRGVVVTAYEQLTAEGIQARVVSMPSWELFEQQSQAYRDEVLPPEVTARVAVEQASSLGWERYVGAHGQIICMHTFGASAPLKALLKKFGFVPESIVAAAKEQLARAREVGNTGGRNAAHGIVTDGSDARPPAS